MPTPKENADEAKQLLARAKQGDRCLAEAQAVEQAMQDLKDSTEFTVSEILSLAGLGLAIVGGIIASFLGGAIGGVLAIVGAGTAALALIHRKMEAIKKASETLAKANERLKQCLDAPP
jgi:hypothetical protein